MTDDAPHSDQIVPDDKDWTWVLESECPECGFDASVIDPTAVGTLIRSNAAAFGRVLESPTDALRTRPRADKWSPLEYGAHVRDVYRLYLERLRLMLDQDDPLYPNWDQDVTAVEDRYNDQNPLEVGADLRTAADELADAFDAVTDDEWQRPGRRSDGAGFTVESFARYLIHDPIHHLWDVSARI